MWPPSLPSRVDPESRFLVAVTGASGVLYARRLIEILGPRTDVILTKDAAPVIEIETGLSTKEFAGPVQRDHLGQDRRGHRGQLGHPRARGGPQGTAAPHPRPSRDALERDRPREPPQVGAPRRRNPASLSGFLWRAPTNRGPGGLRRRPHPRPARRRAFDRRPMDRAAGIAALWLGRHIEEFVELRVEPLEVDVREATGADPADDRDA